MRSVMISAPHVAAFCLRSLPVRSSSKQAVCKRVLVVGADKMSSIVDYQDRTTCIIFGDGAGVVMLEANDEGNGIIDSILKSDGSGWVHLHQKAGGSKRPASIETVMAKEHFIYQEGQRVFKFAVQNMSDVCSELCSATTLRLDDIAMAGTTPGQPEDHQCGTGAHGTAGIKSNGKHSALW